MYNSRGVPTDGFSAKPMQDKLRKIAFSIVMFFGLSGASLMFGDVSGWSATVHAQPAPVSLDAAATMVRRISGGRVVGADSMDDNGKLVYRIKVLLPEGRVRVYLVDPNTGQVLDS